MADPLPPVPDLDPPPPPVPPPARIALPNGIPSAPPSTSRVERITDHLSALSVDLREWVELRIELAKAEVRETVDDVKGKAKRKGVTIGLVAVAALLALYGLGFVFGAISAGFAEWLGHEAWGDAVTALLIFVIAGILVWIAKRRLDQDSAIEAHARVDSPQAALPPATKS